MGPSELSASSGSSAKKNCVDRRIMNSTGLNPEHQLMISDSRQEDGSHGRCTFGSSEERGASSFLIFFVEPEKQLVHSRLTLQNER
jgi:hypothetical protein